MVDFRGIPIREGCDLAYPTRQGSVMSVQEARVLRITAHACGAPCVHAIKRDGKVVRLLNIKNLIVLGVK